MQSPVKLRLGTRGSALALTQARMVAAALVAAHGWPEDAIELVVIKTSGDKILDRPLAEIGGKALFIKELEEALSGRRIDFAVHSAKDVPSLFDPRFQLAAFLEREDPRDVLVSKLAYRLGDLPKGARIGTSSPRRKAQILNHRSDFEIRDFRGNVDTRLRKLSQGEADATILAAAGLKRLGRAAEIAGFIPVDEMIPAAGQGALALEVRHDDHETAARLAQLDHAPTRIAVSAERAVLLALDGSCRTPIGAHARIRGETLLLNAMLAERSGARMFGATIEGDVKDAEALGAEVGRRIKADAPGALLA